MWPEGWESFHENKEDFHLYTAVLCFNPSAARAIILAEDGATPLGPPLNLTTASATNWRNQSEKDFKQFYVYGEESFGAWHPAQWSHPMESWLKVVDPSGDSWNKAVLNDIMEFYYRYDDSIPLESKPLMATNAKRWLKTGSKKDAIRIHRMGTRLEVAAIVQNRLLAHNVFQVQTSKDAAYHCMVFYDQCHLSAEHIPLLWEGDADEECWDALRPFIEKLDTSASHPWSALTVLT